MGAEVIAFRPRRRGDNGILLAWSDGSERRSLAADLMARGYRVWQVASAYQALALLDDPRCRWQAAVLDDELVDQSGLEVAQCLKMCSAMAGERRVTPIVLATPYVVHPDTCRFAGIVTCMTKPVASDELAAAIAGILEHRQRKTT
ncbi:MAG: hypothetical protein P8180_06710 [Gammaproteobacteria bacterium]|jgi:CheY-like chemotaxis protein